MFRVQKKVQMLFSIEKKRFYFIKKKTIPCFRVLTKIEFDTIKEQT